MTRHRLAAWAFTALLTASAPACAPLYVPAVPDRLPPIDGRLRIVDARISRIGGTPAVAFVPAEVPTPGWAAVQWFPPVGAEVASASVWLDEARAGRVVRIAFPDDVAREAPGRWRAVLSFGGRVVRQLEWEEPAGDGRGRAPRGVVPGRA